MDKRIKIKITDNSNTKLAEYANFSIAYSSRKMESSQVSYEIISALKESNDLIIELNSALINLDVQKKNSLRNNFIEGLQNLGIEFTSKKVAVQEGRTILSITLDTKKVEGFEIYALVKHEIWLDKEFKKIIPRFGARYYLPFAHAENNLSAFLELSEDEKINVSKMVVFDNIVLGNMGIATKHIAINELNQLLEK